MTGARGTRRKVAEDQAREVAKGRKGSGLVDRGQDTRFCSKYNRNSFFKNYYISRMESGVSGSKRWNEEMQTLSQSSRGDRMDWPGAGDGGHRK